MTEHHGDPMQHDWIKSTLGHGETMCSRCCITNREAVVLGVADACDVPAPGPKAVNDNVVTLPIVRVERWDDDDGDDDDGDEDAYDESEDCGRWDNGRLSKQCSKAGSEECDWICPIGLPIP